MHLPIYLLGKHFARRRLRAETSDECRLGVDIGAHTNVDVVPAGFSDRLRIENSGVSAPASKRAIEREAVRAGLVIAPFWFLAQWTYSKGVVTTSVTSSTVISTTSVVWTLVASVIFLGEQLTALRLVGVIACMGGNVATLWGGDSQSGQASHFSGDVLCVVAAMLYAVYTIILKRVASENVSVGLLFGALGAAVLVVGLPFVLFFNMSGLRKMTPEVFALLLFNGVFDNVLSQYAWAKAVQWTSPTTATVGLSLTIPLSVVADLARRVVLTGWSFVSMGLVLLGFVAVTLASRPDKNIEHEESTN